MLSELAGFLFPLRCAGCAVLLEPRAPGWLCPSCFARIEWLEDPLCAACGIPLAAGAGACCERCLSRPQSFRRARAVIRYAADGAAAEGVVGSILRRHKYGYDQCLGAVLLECLVKRMPLEPADYDLVAPVPLHWTRLWRRGFNQAALLARGLAARFGLAFEAELLFRRRRTPSQTARGQAARAQNVRHAFGVAKPARLAGRRVLLVDDVMTTGATANECARVMLEAGGHFVDVLALARAV